MAEDDQTWVPEPGTVLDGRYQLGEMVDRGGMGVIIRAEHLHLKRVVAIKLLSPEIAFVEGYRARFLREAGVSAALDHPNIVRCHDSGETSDGLLYLVMELLEGRSLKSVLAREGRFGLHRASDFALQLLDGLAAAHLQGIVHRDLKPGNLYVTKDLRGNQVLKILDFGLAKSLISEDVKLTKTGAICGTTSYLAPETLISDNSSAAADVYACGLIMLEMVLGRKVFGSDIMAQAFLQHLTLAPRIPRRIWDTQYGELVAKALSKHPEDRPAHAEEMFQALSNARSDLPDIRLDLSELPPGPPKDLTSSFLRNLNKAQGSQMATLRELPRPEPWDASDTGDTVAEVVVPQTRRELPIDAAPSPQAEPATLPEPEPGPTGGVREIEFPDVLEPAIELSPVARSTQSMAAHAPARRPLRDAKSQFSRREIVGFLVAFTAVFAGVLWALSSIREPERETPEPRALPTALTRPPVARETAAAIPGDMGSAAGDAGPDTIDSATAEEPVVRPKPKRAKRAIIIEGATETKKKVKVKKSSLEKIDWHLN